VATDSVYYGKLQFNYAKMKPGRHTTWERVWMSGNNIIPSNRDAMKTLLARRVLGDGQPTLVLWEDHVLENVNLTLALATLNHDDGLLSTQIYALNSAPNLNSASTTGAWTAAQEASLTALENALAQSPTKLRVIVGNTTLAEKLEEWRAQHPDSGLKQVLLIPNLGNGG
jgi:hypothetical protein